MNKLIVTTIIWAFSFSLIGEFLRGVDSAFLAFARTFIALVCFLPFMRFRGVRASLALKIALIGAVQIGVMYIFYYKSFALLEVYEVALFTIFTPFYVTLFYDALRLRFRPLYLLGVSVAVAGAAVIKYDGVSGDFALGFLCVQAANLCFGIGQSAYKFLLEERGLDEQKELFGYFFVGASAATGLFALFVSEPDFASISAGQWGVILWLSVVASALGYFLWNKGACEVDSGVLAIMNNVLIPAAIVVNLVFWQKDADLTRLALGAGIMYFSLVLHECAMKYYAKKESGSNLKSNLN